MRIYVCTVHAPPPRLSERNKGPWMEEPAERGCDGGEAKLKTNYTEQQPEEEAEKRATSLESRKGTKINRGGDPRGALQGRARRMCEGSRRESCS